MLRAFVSDSIQFATTHLEAIQRAVVLTCAIEAVLFLPFSFRHTPWLRLQYLILRLAWVWIPSLLTAQFALLELIPIWVAADAVRSVWYHNRRNCVLLILGVVLLWLAISDSYLLTPLWEDLMRFLA